MSSPITLEWIFTELCPFLDLEFWSNLCVQGLFSDTVYAVALKLHTLIQGHYMKSHNSGMDFYWIVTLFGLRILVKPLHARPFLRQCVCCCFETSHTYSGSLDDLFLKSHKSGTDFDWIVPLFGLKVFVKPLHAKSFLRHCVSCWFETSHTYSKS